MDEISSMKEKITNIFETNDKVLQVLQKCEAINNSDEAHGRRIHDLKDSLQRLRKRTQERHNEFQELEEMTRDLGPKLERAATIMRTYKDVVNRDGRRSEDLNIKVDRSESNLQPIVGSPLRRDKSLHGLAKSPGTAISSLTRPALKKKYEHAIEQPDHMQQKGQQPMDTMLQDKIDLTTAIKEMADRAKTELLKGEEEKLPRGDGPDTVLCLDTSGSMKGTAFWEMISLATQFVDGIRRIYHDKRIDVKENIAVSTFGKKPGVPIHLTNQYNKVTEVLTSLKPEGPSPLLEGIYMALAASKGNTTGKQYPPGMNGIIFGARIILISDGKVTPDQWRLNEDMTDLDDIEASNLVNSNITAASDLLRSYGNTLYLVPVGDYTEGPLQRIASLSGGEVIKNQDINRLINHALFHFVAALLVDEGRSIQQHVDLEGFFRSNIGIRTTNPGEQGFDQDMMDVLTLALKFNERRGKGHDFLNIKGNVIVFEEVNSYMLCIGTRVRRNPTRKWTEADHVGPGTIVNHVSDSEVLVLWDCGCLDVCRYVLGIHDVIAVNEKKILAAGKDVGVGCTVKRGRDWTFGDEDGGIGAVGVVCIVCYEERVLVRWPNKKLKIHRFGADGRFEVELMPGHRSTSSTSVLPPRMKDGYREDKPKETNTEMTDEDMKCLNLEVGASRYIEDQSD
ncbi:uncharacterized protein LOC117334724 isoform X3 [Pecten maximus]|uniref:uncharacterized protein LOC117334724 isoform X3 n=1 Tax=Pecten maximus TaxID=6579 RepID=UPI001458C42E|nr:uncharacterized protein LOC117334724 isoform X3 [Pecten maximus]